MLLMETVFVTVTALPNQLNVTPVESTRATPWPLFVGAPLYVFGVYRLHLYDTGHRTKLTKSDVVVCVVFRRRLSCTVSQPHTENVRKFLHADNKHGSFAYLYRGETCLPTMLTQSNVGVICPMLRIGRSWVRLR